MSLYKTTEGKLLIKSGSLMDECCCSSDCNEDSLCNSCTPQLCDSYTVTFSGLSGDLASYNGVHSVWFQWSSMGLNCEWKVYPFTYNPSTVNLFYSLSAPIRWAVKIDHYYGSVGPNCHKEWGHYITFPGEECDPTDNYTQHGACIETTCAGMCAANIGGIATVS